MNNIRLYLPVLLAVTLLGLAGCQDKPAPKAVPTDPDLVTAPTTLLPYLKTALVGTAPVSDSLRVAGRIDYDEQRVARIGAPVTGRVMELLANAGDRVHQGQALALLHSTELGAAQLAYLKARAQAQLLAQAAERARLLLAADVIGAAELQRRESELAIAQAEQRAATDQLRVLGLSATALEQMGRAGVINSVSPALATLSGVVVERKVAKGQVVQPADALYTVADLSRVWVVAQVPEAEISRVRVGQAVQVDIPALADTTAKPLSGHLVHVGDIVNPDTRTVTVRTELDNREYQLKPAMLATMRIEARPREQLVLPAIAVVREDNVDHVFTDLGKQRFRLVRVKLGPETQGWRVVEAGVKAGEKIVVEGAFHLNNERKRAELEGQ
ncbi:MAG: efflux RND transporter periplasmic adaptor subunit [Proteobacteria bacterium]|nr:efflux RND transporter periplasmic adaptor subunit [Pseudomonadota bacterium]HQR03649.1 efflux RND transporter periplasmic adaptor subunit [Rhodocyclaceae bacterium]